MRHTVLKYCLQYSLPGMANINIRCREHGLNRKYKALRLMHNG